MKELSIPVSLTPFVKDIHLLESAEQESQHRFPFYADGFPGIIFSESAQPFYLQPRNKVLSDFYLYGQTVEPIALEVKGPFRLIFIRLFPFTIRLLLNVNPEVLIDDCFDLLQIKNVDTQATLDQLRSMEDPHATVEILADYFNALLKNASVNLDHSIQLATNLILKSGGTLPIKEVRSRLYVAERTFERQFKKEIGVTPKQFAKIIQFSSSLNQITDEAYVRLTEVSYNNGYADQSHFIRTFKRYTGQTPKEFQKQIS